MRLLTFSPCGLHLYSGFVPVCDGGYLSPFLCFCYDFSVTYGVLLWAADYFRDEMSANRAQLAARRFRAAYEEKESGNVFP